MLHSFLLGKARLLRKRAFQERGINMTFMGFESGFLWKRNCGYHNSPWRRGIVTSRTYFRGAENIPCETLLLKLLPRPSGVPQFTELSMPKWHTYGYDCLRPTLHLAILSFTFSFCVFALSFPAFLILRKWRRKCLIFPQFSKYLENQFSTLSLMGYVIT